MKIIGIDLKSVRAVLLADGWHAVAGESYEMVRFTGDEPGSRAAGFYFLSGSAPGEWYAGPLSSVLAVRGQEEETRGV